MTASTMGATRTDQAGSRWGINDEVVRLREWGSDRVHDLAADQSTMLVGKSPVCAIQLNDPSVSRAHLQLSYVDGSWIAVDRGSKNGTRIDGLRSRTFVLLPGCEVRVGSVVMIAESQRWIALRNLLRRLLGWSDDRTETIDIALRSIRQAAFGHGPLYIIAPTDPVPIAASIHRYVWGSDRPFVMSDPRRSDGDVSARAVANKPTAVEAFAEAHRGTLCVRARRVPADLYKVLSRLGPTSRVLLAVVETSVARFRYTADAIANPPILVPTLFSRADELPRMIDEYAADAAKDLSLSRGVFTDEDRAWIIEHAAKSQGEIEKATQRLLALRVSPSVSSAAARLDMAQVSLARWLGRRTLPASIERRFRD